MHQVVRLGVELGLAVNDYNSQVTNDFTEIIRTTLSYLEKVKEAVREGVIEEREIPDYFALVGQSWGAIQARDI